MNKLILLCLVALALIHSTFAAECTANVIQVESAGSWDEAHLHKRVIDLHIVNSHPTCTFSDSVTLSITPEAGGFVGNKWGINKDNVVAVGSTALQPTKIHSGLGLVYSGAGKPKVEVIAFGNCDCNLSPQNPTSAPTADPTTPTSAPVTPAPTTPPTLEPSSYYTLGLKFAILTCNSSDIRLPVVKSILDAVGSPYDIFERITWGTSPLELEINGNGKYYAMVATFELHCWTDEQVRQINEYNIKNKVKMVILYTNPYSGSGVASAGTASIPVEDKDTYIQFADAMLPSVGPLVHDAHITIGGVYLNKITIQTPAITKAAVDLYHGGSKYQVACFIKYDDGRHHLEFYLDSADWATFPTILGTAWLNWVTNGVFAGVRRIEFNAHMDDIFMSTGTFNPDTGKEDESEPMKYRIVPDDLEKTLAWQDNLNAHLTPGSNVTLTFPYNGATVQEKGGFLRDALFLKAKELREEFIWESHTWSHPYLTNLSKTAVRAQYDDNVETLAELFDVDPADINKIPQYCAIATITPSITGLDNPQAMEAMYEFGIRFVVGDNSRWELIPPNLYHVLHSNKSANGVDGINIVPRHATNIYYDASLPKHITDQFNYRYSDKFGDLSFDEVVQRDVQVAVKALLLFRHDPFMFHQANLRFSEDGYSEDEHSLLSYWVDAVLGELEKYISLPIISRKHEDLGKVFLDREARDNCGFEGTLKLIKGTGEVVGINAKSSGSCIYGISGVQTEDGAPNVHDVEHYGEEVTTWLNMEAGKPVDVLFLEHITPL